MGITNNPTERPANIPEGQPFAQHVNLSDENTKSTVDVVQSLRGPPSTLTSVKSEPLAQGRPPEAHLNMCRGTGGGRLPGFRGRVLQLTGLARFGGVFGSLEYQQQADVPAPAMEVEVEATEAAAAADSDTATQAPPSYLESGPAAPVPQPPVRPRRQQRPRRTDTLLRVSSQCDQSLELTEKLLDVSRPFV
nr:uncharacterized protein LOC119161886 [Rhipicephalus microplus]